MASHFSGEVKDQIEGLIALDIYWYGMKAGGEERRSPKRSWIKGKVRVSLIKL